MVLPTATACFKHYKALINLSLFQLILAVSLLTRIEVPAISASLYFPAIAVVGITAIALNWRTLYTRILAQKLLFGIATFCYFWVWIATWKSPYPSTALSYTVKYSSYGIILLAFLALLIPRYEQYQKILFRFLILIAMGGVIEVAFPHLRVLNWLRYPDHYPRISSIVQGPNQFGVLMALGAIFAILLLTENIISRWEFTLTIGVFIVLTCLSASINSWLVLAIGLGLVAIYRVFKIKAIIAIALLWGICLLIFPLSAYRLIPQQSVLSPIDRNSTQLLINKLNNPTLEHPELAKSSISARKFLWRQAVQQGIKQPITGLGVGVFAEHISSEFYQRTGFHAHNLFLSIFAELGIVGLSLIIAWIGLFFWLIPTHQAQIMIPLILLFSSQLFDFFINDYTFGAIALYFIADPICRLSPKNLP